MTDDDLEALFRRARAAAPRPSEGLMARVLADAERLRRERLAPAPRAPARRGWFAALGGWPALGTLLASAVFGVGVGVAQPASLAGLSGAVAGAVLGESVTVSAGLDDPLLAWEG